jgi:hypothetical protein
MLNYTKVSVIKNGKKLRLYFGKAANKNIFATRADEVFPSICSLLSSGSGQTVISGHRS